MTSEPHTPSDVIGHRLKELRNRHGWTAAELGKRCGEVGLPLTRQAITNIEAGRRDDEGARRRHVTVDELLALSLVLNVAPVNLMIPIDSSGTYPVTSTNTVHTQLARNWVRGTDPLPDMDERVFFSEVPSDEFRVMRVSELNRAEQGREA